MLSAPTGQYCDSRGALQAIDSDVPAAAYQVLQLPADGAMPEEAASEGLRQGLDYVGLLAFPCRFGGAFLGGSDCGSQVV